MSNNGNPQTRQTPNKAFAKTPKVFVPKTHDQQNPSATTLSGSLRQSLPPKPRAAGFSFVNYLPQDEAVAAGLGADQGALDPIESQRVVDLLNQELSRLLKLSPKEFWREVASDTSLHEFLDSFLRFRSRWYDLPHHGPKEMVAGVIVGELELSRRVFMILYRISSNRDPGARATDSLSPKDHGVLLQEKKLLDLPKLLDICAIYGRENEDLTRDLVKNALSSQPWIHDNLPSVISQFLNIVNTMHQRFNTSLEVLFSSGSQDHGSTRLYADMLEVMDFINDAIVSMDAFINAYEPAALFFLLPVEIRDGNEELLCTLAKLHDSLIPSLQKAFHKILSSGQDTMVSNIGVGMNLLAMRIIKFGWNLLDFCYLSDEAFVGDLMPAATKMFPANVEDPFIRADILIQTFREISAVSMTSQENHNRLTLLQNIDKYFHIISEMEELQSKGWIFMDEEQLEYVSGIFVNSAGTTVKKLPSLQNPMPSNKVGMDEDAVVMESKISQIKDLFPDFGKGFLAACLEAYNHNPEEVIQKILDGSLHEDLQSLDTSLETMPRPKATPTVMKNDKGKGKLVDSEPTVSMAGQSTKQNEGPSVSSSSPLVGRFVRKARGDGPDSTTLDDKKAKDQAKIAALSSQYEYDDEYDDSFDDLGLSVAESGVEVDEILGSRMSSSSSRGKSWEKEQGGEAPPQNPSNSSKWGSRKKPQYYVKDGKNYSYKVEGSVAVANASEASLVNQAQVELIHGLGRGGNHPLGAVKQLMEATEQKDKQPQQQRVNTWGRGRRGGAVLPNGDHENQPQIGGASESSQIGENSGGPSRGRGRRGGGRHSNYRKDRAAAKHFSGLGGI